MSSNAIAVAGRGRAAAEDETDHISLSLLGAFELLYEDRPISLPMSAQRLLAFLALHEHTMLRVYVAGVLWIDASEERASANLRSSLWRLQKPGYRLVETTSTQLRIAPDLRVDVKESAALAHRLISGLPDPDEVDITRAKLDRELLPDWYDDWVLFERERFRQLGLHALEALGERQIRAGHLGSALEAALAAVRGEPLRESAHRLLIRVHLAEGNVGEALRHYGLCRRLLHDQLGLTPSPQLEELVRALTE